MVSNLVRRLRRALGARRARRRYADRRTLLLTGQTVPAPIALPVGHGFSMDAGDVLDVGIDCRGGRLSWEYAAVYAIRVDQATADHLCGQPAWSLYFTRADGEA